MMVCHLRKLSALAPGAPGSPFTKTSNACTLLAHCKQRCLGKLHLLEQAAHCLAGAIVANDDSQWLVELYHISIAWRKAPYALYAQLRECDTKSASELQTSKEPCQSKCTSGLPC